MLTWKIVFLLDDTHTLGVIESGNLFALKSGFDISLQFI